MPALSEHANVDDTALSVLTSKGFQVWHDKETETYYAEKEGWDFASESPCGLLGLVAIFEYLQPKQYSDYWWRVSRDAFRDIGALPRSYISVMTRGKPVP